MGDSQEAGSSSGSVNFKRFKLDSKQAEENVAENRESDQQNSVFVKAFETDLVREGIFKYLSTSELLSTFSLVSKNWNTKVRSFIYSHRKCTPINNPEVSVCESLENINQLCRQMTAQGRTIPFNGLNLYSYKQCPRDSNEKKSGGAIDLESLLVVKHLQAFAHWNQSECSFRHPLSTLLSESRRAELRSLTVGNILLLGKILDQSGWEKPFTKLKEFTILVGAHHYNAEKDLPEMKDTLAEFLELAPNLMVIVAMNSRALEFVPEEKYGLLKSLEFELIKAEDVDMLHKIATQSCQVEQLVVHEPPVYTEYAHGFEENFDANVRHQFNATVQQLLQTCQNSLTSISINSICYSLAQLSHAPLTKLTKLKMEKLFDATTDEFWDAIASVDYSRVAPQLKEMEVVMGKWEWTSNEMYELGYDAEKEWPENNDHTMMYGCSSVRKLTLEAVLAKINLRLLKTFLPNVSELELKVSHTANIEGEGHLPDISEIFQLWPALKQLTITGEENCLRRSYDADFCGIHPKEVESLVQKDETYLKTVHIVPIRPCLNTMTDLCKLRIDLKFSWTAEIGGSDVAFITKVTELIALKRMANKDFCISWGEE